MNATSREASVFYALDLLEAEELRAFEDQLVTSAHLRQEVIAWQNCVGDLSLTVPPGDPSPGLLANIHAEIDAGRKLATYGRYPLAFWSGWAAAACFAALAAWLFLNQSDVRKNRDEHTAEKSHSPARRVKSTQGSASPGSEENRHGRADDSAPGSANRRGETGLSKRSITPRVGDEKREARSSEPAPADLNDQLRNLRALHHQRFMEVPGQARLVIFEMYGAAGTRSESSEANLITAQTAAELLASSASPETEDNPPVNTIRLDDNAFLGFGALLESLQQFSNIPGMAATAPPPQGAEGDQSPGPGEADIQLPVGEDSEGAVVAPPEPASAPDALMFFDETSGQGSLILQDLAPSRDGRDYQLWMVDPRRDDPIPLAVLPPLGEGGTRIHFDLPGQGYAPSRFLVTEEPLGGSSSPSATIILDSPSPDSGR